MFINFLIYMLYIFKKIVLNFLIHDQNAKQKISPYLILWISYYCFRCIKWWTNKLYSNYRGMKLLKDNYVWIKHEIWHFFLACYNFMLCVICLVEMINGWFTKQKFFPNLNSKPKLYAGLGLMKNKGQLPNSNEIKMIDIRAGLWGCKYVWTDMGCCFLIKINL